MCMLCIVFIANKYMSIKRVWDTQIQVSREPIPMWSWNAIYLKVLYTVDYNHATRRWKASSLVHTQAQ